MKRALAERAKQSGLPNGGGPLPLSVPSSETTTGSSSNIVSSNNINSNSNSSVFSPPELPAKSSLVEEPAPQQQQEPPLLKPSPRPKKRLRESVKLLEEEDDDEDESNATGNAAAFYLRHQNRALASELRHLQFMLSKLERERDTRRSQCSLAVRNLTVLQTTWTQLEEALLWQNNNNNNNNNNVPQQPPAPAAAAAAETANRETSGSGALPPSSTGTGTSVELVGALFRSIAALGTNGNPATRSRPRIKSETGDDETMQVDRDLNDDDDNDDSSTNSSTSSSGGGAEQQKLLLRHEPIPPGDEDDEENDAEAAAANAQIVNDLLRITDTVAQRASTLQGWIWSLLQRLEKGEDSATTTSNTTINLEDANNSSSSNIAQKIHAVQQQVARLKAKNKLCKAQMKELARTRDDAQEAERRVRRGLYRLAAGRVQLNEVLKAIVATDEDKQLAEEWMGPSSSTATNTTATLNTTLMATTMGTASTSTATTTTTAAPSTFGESKEIGDGKETSSTPVSWAEVSQLQKKLLDLEQVASARDEQIKTLLMEREEQTKKINSLLLANSGKMNNGPTDDELKQSDLYAELSSKVSAAERLVKEAAEREQKIKQEWGQALATAEEAQKALEELNTKHLKRWQDLAEEFPDFAANVDVQMEGDDGTDDNGRQSNDPKSKEIVILQHKLTQALENVRQAQTTRKTLQEAVIMNESLQAKLEEIKAKYTSLQHSRSNGAPTGTVSSAPIAVAPAVADADGLNTPKGKSPAPDSMTSEKPEKIERPDKSDKAADKLHREYRRVQKQLAAAMTSKEAAKAKFERAEKERETLALMNSRLLKQAAEKDEMNAKSLSTILHLKQLTDQITKEKENLEQQVKSSQQLALSARLAANARERLYEELDKERQSMEARVQEWEDKCQALAREKEQVEAKLAQNRARMAGLFKDVEGAKNRCDELASETTKIQEQKHKMMESLAIARKEAEEASALTERISQASGGAIVEGFTAEQLHTQVKHLKTRLNCPVCNARDKKCILLRCRHMFCKNCVDESIKNRSRKCPACGIRFDTKDVADIWL